jgi:hypothetical protein
MQRTQVFINDNQQRDIKILASMTGKPKAEIIRTALEHGLRTLSDQQAGSAKGLVALAALGTRLKVKGPKDLSTTIDTHLYE